MNDSDQQTLAAEEDPNPNLTKTTSGERFPQDTDQLNDQKGTDSPTDPGESDQEGE